MQNMSGISSAQKKLVLGSNVNGNGIVQLNRLNITNITASGATVLADNSIDNGNNTGITFTAPTGKNLYCWRCRKLGRSGTLVCGKRKY
jgi:hypothetical protein